MYLEGIPYVESLEYLAKIIWNDPTNNTITKTYLTHDVVDKFNAIRTKLGSTLAHCIRNSNVHYFLILYQQKIFQFAS